MGQCESGIHFYVLCTYTTPVTASLVPRPFSVLAACFSEFVVIGYVNTGNKSGLIRPYHFKQKLAPIIIITPVLSMCLPRNAGKRNAFISTTRAA